MTETGVAVTAPRAPSITSPPVGVVPRRIPMGARPPAVFSREWAVVGHVSTCGLRARTWRLTSPGAPCDRARCRRRTSAPSTNCADTGPGPSCGTAPDMCRRSLSLPRLGLCSSMDGCAHRATSATTRPRPRCLRPVRCHGRRLAGPCLGQPRPGGARAQRVPRGLRRGHGRVPDGRARPRPRTSHEIVADWKVYAENYLEGYHIPLVHRELNREIDAAATRSTSVTAGAGTRRRRGAARSTPAAGSGAGPTWPSTCTRTR